MGAIEERRSGARAGGTGDLGALGRYQLLEPIASSGMGATYLARLAGDGGFEKLVALKVLLPDISRDARFVAMFLDEARIAARLSHPNVCEVYELGSADGRHFIAMQYLRGVPLGDVLRAHPRDRPTYIRMIASLLAQACEGLHHAHELRDADGHPLDVVHRDVSPPNLFVTSEGVLKVLDFGIAKAADIESTTRRSEVKGKQAYMSPEQLIGKTLDRRSDVFAIGVVLYEGITGTRLFARDDSLIAKAILEEDIEDPRQRRAEVSPALAAVALKALARRPEDRFATARELGLAIGEALAPDGPMSPVMLADYLGAQFGARLAADEARFERATRAASRIADTSAATRRGGPRPSRPRASRRWMALVVVALAASLGVAGWVLWQRRAEAPGPPVVSVASGTAADAAPIAASREGATARAVDAGVSATSESSDAAPLDAGVLEAAPADDRPGWISIDSHPYATIYVDGRRAGVTPLISYKVRPGRRRIKAVLASGKTKRFSIRVRPGRRAAAKHLTW